MLKLKETVNYFTFQTAEGPHQLARIAAEEDVVKTSATLVKASSPGKTIAIIMGGYGFINKNYFIVIFSIKVIYY